MKSFIYSFLLLLLLPLAAQEAPAPAEEKPASPEKPEVIKTGETTHRLGQIDFDQKTRQISFPVTVNMTESTEYPLEFILVHEKGKIHESLLRTTINPVHLNVALKLLRYQESQELFQLLDKDFRPTGKYPEVPEETKAAARVDLFLQWKDPGGAEKKLPLNGLVLHKPTARSLADLAPALPWVYNGSYVHEGVFKARVNGNIIAIFEDNSCLFNLPHKDRALDTVWFPHTKRLPPVETPATLILQPHPPANPDSK